MIFTIEMSLLISKHVIAKWNARFRRTSRAPAPDRFETDFPPRNRPARPSARAIPGPQAQQAGAGGTRHGRQRNRLRRRGRSRLQSVRVPPPRQPRVHWQLGRVRLQRAEFQRRPDGRVSVAQRVFRAERQSPDEDPIGHGLEQARSLWKR